MRKKYFDWEQAFQYVWNNADDDGLWNGDAAKVADEFNVSEDSAHSVLSQLCDRHLIELVDERTYAITNWPDKHDSVYEGQRKPPFRSR